MKFFLSSFIILASCFTLSGHEYHFAFAEAAFNAQTETIQATITFSTRDFEHSLEHDGMSIEPLEKYENDKMMQLFLADELLKHFQMYVGEKQCQFGYVGYEVLNNGTTNFYFESQKIEITSDINVHFDLMMDHNPKQQNKLNFIYLTKNKSIEFLSNQPTQVIKLETLLE